MGRVNKRNGDEGQAIILSVILTCLLLLTIMYYVSATINAENATMRDEVISSSGADNVLWAQGQGLKACAIKASGIYPWEQRGQAVERFNGLANAISGNISKSLLARGISYSIVFNDTLAKAGVQNSTMESIGGVIVKNTGGAAMIHGYAFDMELYDGETRYRTSKVMLIE